MSEPPAVTAGASAVETPTAVATTAEVSDGDKGDKSGVATSICKKPRKGKAPASDGTTLRTLGPSPTSFSRPPLSFLPQCVGRRQSPVRVTGSCRKAPQQQRTSPRMSPAHETCACAWVYYCLCRVSVLSERHFAIKPTPISVAELSSTMTISAVS
jgi:hypothetical protein